MTRPARPRAWISWSTGKDSTLALHTARAAGEVDVVGLLTTVNSTADRVAMHAVRGELLHAQADALGLPLHVVDLPAPCPNEVYEQRMSQAIEAATADGVEQMIFGDIFLADVRAYREQMLADTGMTAVFPLWRQPTDTLAREIIATGIRAVITCVDPGQAPERIAGQWYDEALLRELPVGVDACGEHGEFHTFVVDGPGFGRSLDVVVGETIERDGFLFTDVRTADQAG